MKEYKVVEAIRTDAEQKMNEMAKQGWEVVDVTFWYNVKATLIITFSREV